jgi:Protein of unknown function (DUF1217)
MSGSINYAQLFGASTSSSNTLVNIIYGINTTSPAGDPNALQALTLAEKNQTQDIATTAQEPQVQRDIAAFQSAVSTATDPATLLKNPTVLKVLLTANGLGDQVAYPALAQQALLSDPNNTNSLVNQLTNTLWKSTAQTYNFATQGLSVIRSASVQSTIANAYAEVTWRKSLDATTPGLSNALTFRQQASSIKSVDQILGDPTLRTVVTTALGIPQQIAFQDLGAQEKAISSVLDISRFQDQHFVESFTQQYLLTAQTNASNAAGSSSTSTTSLFV